MEWHDKVKKGNLKGEKNTVAILYNINVVHVYICSSTQIFRHLFLTFMRKS